MFSRLLCPAFLATILGCLSVAGNASAQVRVVHPDAQVFFDRSQFLSAVGPLSIDEDLEGFTSDVDFSLDLNGSFSPVVLTGLTGSDAMALFQSHGDEDTDNFIDTSGTDVEAALYIQAPDTDAEPGGLPDWVAVGFDVPPTTPYTALTAFGFNYTAPAGSVLFDVNDQQAGGASVAQIVLPGGTDEFVGVVVNGENSILNIDFAFFRPDPVALTPLSVSFRVDDFVGGTSGPQLGDFNGDGIVGIADYVIWRDNLGATDENSLNGAGDGMNGVDLGDYNLWKEHFGAGDTASAALAAIPEPAAITILFLTCGALLLLRRGESPG